MSTLRFCERLGVPRFCPCRCKRDWLLTEDELDAIFAPRVMQAVDVSRQ